MNGGWKKLLIASALVCAKKRKKKQTEMEAQGNVCSLDCLFFTEIVREVLSGDDVQFLAALPSPDSKSVLINAARQCRSLSLHFWQKKNNPNFLLA